MLLPKVNIMRIENKTVSFEIVSSSSTNCVLAAVSMNKDGVFFNINHERCFSIDDLREFEKGVSETYIIYKVELR